MQNEAVWSVRIWNRVEFGVICAQDWLFPFSPGGAMNVFFLAKVSLLNQIIYKLTNHLINKLSNQLINKSTNIIGQFVFIG